MRLSALSVLVLALAVTGCSFSASVGGSPTSAAEEVIEDDLAAQLGFGEIEAECGEPPNEDEGATFLCTSETDHGLVRWEATMAEEDTVNVQSLNVLVEDDVAALEVAAAAEIEQVVGLPLGTEHFDCGAAPVVLGAEDQVVCALTDPADGDVYDTTVIITDMSSGAFEFEVAEEPR
jgi:hypothetical protein